MSVDWSQFRDGDKIRVSLEGTYRSEAPDMSEQIVLGNDVRLYLYASHSAGFRDSITSAELIERTFTPPAEGKLFRSRAGVLYISHGEGGYRALVDRFGRMCDDTRYDWSEDTSVSWRDGIEVLNV